jgi:hypothetical protein
MLRGKRSCRVWRKYWTCWEGREVVEFDESIVSSLSTCPMLWSNSTTSLFSQHAQCFRQTLQLLFLPNMFNAFVVLNMSRGKRSCRVWRKHWTCWEGREVVEFNESIEHVEREEQHVQCFRQILQLLFPLNMFNAFVKLYNLNMLRGKRSCRVLRKHWTCWEGREVVEFDESIEHVEHVEREEKL